MKLEKEEPLLTPLYTPFDQLLAKYEDKLIKIDVSGMEMPLPMNTILEKLSVLPAGNALFVCHKKVPVYLLPHLHDLGFEYLIQEENTGKISMLIYKP